MRWERWNICGGAVFFIETNRGRPFIPERSGGGGSGSGWERQEELGGTSCQREAAKTLGWKMNVSVVCLSVSS